MTKKVTIELERYEELLTAEFDLRLLNDVGRIHKTMNYEQAFDNEELIDYFNYDKSRSEGLEPSEVYKIELEKIHNQAQTQAFDD